MLFLVFFIFFNIKEYEYLLSNNTFIMSRNTRRHSNLQNTFKDYFVPIIGWVLIIILLYSFFNGNKTTSTSININENKIPAKISFWSPDTEAFISYSWKNQEKITESQSLYKWETLIVKEWSVSLNSANGTRINLNKIAELKYEEDGSYSLYSSDAWFELKDDTNISMKFANIQARADSVLSLTQNEAGSTIYILSWSAKVANLAGRETLLIKWQKISISRQNAANKDIDLGSEKSNIDSYFKGSDWFIENKGHIILQQNDEDNSKKDSEEKKSSQVSSWRYISFDSLRDEMSIKGNSLNISWKILSESVGSITINNRQVNISTTTKSFSLDSLSLSQSVNDIVVKIYDTDKNIIKKSVYTVYTSSQNNPSTSRPLSQWSTTYDVDATDFRFTDPSNTGKFSTTSSEVTIRGITSAKGISRVEVNGFKLASFNGSTWRYHAFKRFETLEEGTNQYRIDYFWEDGKIVYTDYYTIVKKSASQSPKKEKVKSKEKIISDEA